VRGDHVDASHMVGGVPEGATQRAETTAERVAHGADGRRRTAQGGETERRGLVDDPLPPDSRVDAGGPVVGVDADPLHPAGIDQQRAIGGHGWAVSGVEHPYRQPPLGGERHGRHDIGGPVRPDQDGRPVLDGEVVARARRVVALVIRQEHRSEQPGRQRAVDGAPATGG